MSSTSAIIGSRVSDERKYQGRVAVGITSVLSPNDSVAELAITARAAAIANAVHHSTGTRVRSSPISIEKVLGRESASTRTNVCRRPSARLITKATPALPYNRGTVVLTPGTRLGPYEVVSAIGAGGMGEVYRATDTKLKRQVAIKILPARLAADHDRLARFQREAEVSHH